MPKATDALLRDHKMIRKLLEAYSLDNPRFDEIFKTTARVVKSHAWFEDEIFLPAFKAEPLLVKRFSDEIVQEHRDLDYLMVLLHKTPEGHPRERAALVRQFRAILETHLKKEEDALFPLAETILDSEGLNRLGAEMERRQDEVRKWVLENAF